MKINWHRVATVLATAGAFAAHYIPAALVIPLGPVAIPVAAAVEGGLVLAAAAGIAPSPLLAKVMGALVKKPPPGNT